MATEQMQETTEHRTEASFLERLAEKVGGNASVRRVYGEPVENDGVMVIPVAKVGFGFGGGGGSSPKEGEGSGGGGGAQVTPIGYIEIKEGSSEFRSINDFSSLVPVIVAGGFAGALVIRALAKAFRKGDKG